jgi:catecholate siderophore receptor
VWYVLITKNKPAFIMEKNASLPFGSFNSLALFTGLCLGASPATGIAAEKSVKNSEETLVVEATRLHSTLPAPPPIPSSINRWSIPPAPSP